MGDKSDIINKFNYKLLKIIEIIRNNNNGSTNINRLCILSNTAVKNLPIKTFENTGKVLYKNHEHIISDDIEANIIFIKTVLSNNQSMEEYVNRDELINELDIYFNIIDLDEKKYYKLQFQKLLKLYILYNKK